MSRLGTRLVEANEALQADERLPGLSRLFETTWVWQSFCDCYGPPEDEPDRVRLTQLRYEPGVRALASYSLDRTWGRWVVEDQFAIELRAGRPVRLFRYPDDPYLPGLAQVASATETHELLSTHVGLHANRVDVEVIRYRPATRAVLRHTVDWRRGNKMPLYVRVLPPGRVGRVREAARLASFSGFHVAELVASLPESGVLWLAGVPGSTVRTLIRAGTPPAPDAILDGLAPLWSAPAPERVDRSMHVGEGFRWTRGLLARAALDEGVQSLLGQVTALLEPFAEAWRPTVVAHNDFYDDQLLLTPSGRLALVDFEEVGPGDPLLDVGTFLAHLRWMMGPGATGEACAVYRERLRGAALSRFGWREDELARREAYALFRLSSNAVRQIRPNWQGEVERGLRLTLEAIEEVA